MTEAPTAPVPTTIPDTATTNVPATTVPTTLPSAGHLDLGAPSAAPGFSVTSHGAGCTPGSTVLLSVADRPAGQTVAGGDGTFTASVVVPNVPVGSYRVVASCGTVINADLSVAVVTKSNPGTSTLVVLCFFVLLAGILVFRQFEAG